METTPEVLIVATMDTKAKEALFLADVLKGQGLSPLIMDAGIMGTCDGPAAVTREEVARAAEKDLAEVRAVGHEGKAMEIMLSGAVKLAMGLFRDGRIRGIIAPGGSMGTTLGTGVMRAFPLGFPKVMISTMASRNTRHFVGTRDILMLHSVCDLSGLNRITRRVLRNGALALAGMVRGSVPREEIGRSLVTLSNLGTTEACARLIREELAGMGYEVVTFHGIGAGGEAMEELIGEEPVDGVVDLSIHEILDHHFGGDYDAGPFRGRAALEKGIPTVFVPGNIDFLAAGPLTDAEKRFPGRSMHSHNRAITCVRSGREEVRGVAGILADYLKDYPGPFRVLVPERGFSALDREGGPLYDPVAPGLFLEKLREDLDLKTDAVRGLPNHINDPDFARAVVGALREILPPL